MPWQCNICVRQINKRPPFLGIFIAQTVVLQKSMQRATEPHRLCDMEDATVNGMRTSIPLCLRSLMQYMCAGVGAVTTGPTDLPCACAAFGRSRAQSAP